MQKKVNENKDFCFDLGISTVTALRSDGKHLWPPRARQGYGSVRLYADPRKILNDQWLDQLESQGLSLSSVIIFYKGAGYEPSVAHTDVAIVQGKKWPVPCALNWTIGGRGSTMRWYRDDFPTKNDLQESGNLPLMTHDIAQLVELYRAEIPNDRLTMVRTDIPHRACSDQEERWCISARFAEGRFKDWYEASASVMDLLGLDC